MRAVILAGGKGTRLSPSTRVTNKHLLPVYTPSGAFPMIYYPIRTLISGGIHDILIVSSREHCGHIIENLSDGYDFQADFSYKIQDTDHVEMGIASALKLAKNYVNDEKFAVILGDNFFEDCFKEQFETFQQQDAPAVVFLKEVEDIRRFGCATIDESTHQVTKIVEKPRLPESNWAVTGLYLYTPQVFEVADTLKPSGRSELEVTDINNYYCGKGLSPAFVKGYWSDMGTPESLVRTQEFITQSNFRLKEDTVEHLEIPAT